MYTKNLYCQSKFNDFQQPIGLHLNPENRWIRQAETIPWDEIEKEYAKLFSGIKGRPAKPVRMALGSLLIQKQFHYSDRELIEQIRENPYYQYFIGLPGYQEEEPFAPSLLVEFRKRLSETVLCEINEMIIRYNKKKDSNDKNDDSENPAPDKETEDVSEKSAKKNKGTLMIDATCAPQHIAFPQDICLLNQSREDLEEIIDDVCEENGLSKSRTYRKNARKDYLNLAKCKKRSRNKIRKAIKKQLQYIRRDLGYIDGYLEQGIILSQKQMKRLSTIREVYEQQRTMYETNTNSIPNRIVSLSQPYLRPIVRGKTNAPTEFCAKLDMSVDDEGLARPERISFSAFNESEDLITIVERFFERTDHYPEVVKVDKIYRNRVNLRYCDEHGIRLSGAPLGRPKKDNSVEKKIEYQDAVDRIEVERKFSLAKRSFGLDKIWTKLAETTRSSIVLSIIAMNVRRLKDISFYQFLERVFRRYICLISDENSGIPWRWQTALF